MVIYDNSTNILIIPDGTVGPDIEDRFEDKTVEITENGDYLITPDEGYDALSSVELSVNVSCDDAYNSGYTDGIEYQKSLLVATAITNNGTYERADGYSSITVNVDTVKYARASLSYNGPESELQDVIRKGGYATITETPSSRSTPFPGPSSSYTFEFGVQSDLKFLPGVDVTISFSEVEGYLKPNDITIKNTGWNELIYPIHYRYIFDVGDNLVVECTSVSEPTTVDITPSSVLEGTFEYRKTAGVWTTISGNTRVTLEPGEKVEFRGDNPQYSEDYSNNTNIRVTGGGAKVYGNVMSLIADADEFPTGSDYNFCGLFQNSYSLTDASNLSLPSGLTQGCYQNMFKGCNTLTGTPELNATQIVQSCYEGMFEGCSSLTTAPDMPGQNLAKYGYKRMFANCGSLRNNIPASLPGDLAYYGCCYEMFLNCTSLTTAPALPATEIHGSAYMYMFKGCSSLTTAPELPATILTSGPDDIGEDTTGITHYSGMFWDCTGLTTAPAILPATGTLPGSCYSHMFQGCTSLTTAPILPAEDQGSFAYGEMFRGCSNLNYVKCLSQNTNNTRDWLNGVAETGTFVKDANTTWQRGPSAIPVGWWVEDDDPGYSAMGLTLEVLSAGTIVFGKTTNGPADAFLPYLNGVNIGPYNPALGTSGWITNNTTKFTVDVVPGDKFQLIGAPVTFQTLGNGSGNHTFCGTTATFKAYGNALSVCAGPTFAEFETFAEATSGISADASYALTGLFAECTGLTDASNLIFPKDTTHGCYAEMFAGCTSLTKAPKLPSSAASDFCYGAMFSGCTSLATAPELPATTVGSTSYDNLFAGCTSITTAPELPATTLGTYCYRAMFAGCTGLTTAPELPATNLQEGCYNEMFYGCTSLTTAPVLPAVNPKHLCYANMFQGCTSLNYVKCLFVYEDVMMDPTGGWLYNVSPTGTFVKDARMQEFETGPDGIPTGWTVIDAE